MIHLGFFDILPTADMTVDFVPVAMAVKFTTLALIVLLIFSTILPAVAWPGSSHFDFLLFSSVTRQELVTFNF